MSTPVTYAGSKEDELDCLATRTHLLGDTHHPALDAHLSSCEPCAMLAADTAMLAHALDELPLPELDLEAMAANIQHQLGTEKGLRSRLRRLSTPKRIAVLFTFAAVIAGLTGGLAPRVDLAVYPMVRMVPIAIAMTLSGLFALFRGLRPVAASRATPWIVGLTGLILPFVCAGLPAAHVDHPMALIDGNFIPKTLACFAFGAVVAAAVGKLAHLLDRRSHVDLTAAMMIAIGGSMVGNLALQLHCPITDPMHLLVGHASVGAVFAVALAALLRPRS